MNPMVNVIIQEIESELIYDLKLEILPRVGEELYIDKKIYKVTKISHNYNETKRAINIITLHVEEKGL